MNNTNVQIKLISISNTEEILEQNVLSTVEHKVPKQYQILSKNDFGKVPNRINIGVFNKKSNIVVSEDQSILVYSKKDKKVLSTSIVEIQKDNSNYFLIYKYIFDKEKTSQFYNYELNFEDINTGETYILSLNYNSGYFLGTLINLLINKNSSTLEDLHTIEEIDNNLKEELFPILKDIIYINNNKFNLNKNILMNSNPEFLLGILYAFFEDKKYFRVSKKINIYIFSTILNLLGASYSIRNSNIPEDIKNEYPFIIRFKLPHYLKEFIPDNSLNLDIFRKYKFLFLPKKVGENKDFELKYFYDITKLEKINYCDYDNEEFTAFMKEVNKGNIELVPCNDILFRELPEEEKLKVLYDLTMENHNADNFWLAGNPWFKNSDGDIMAVFGIMTKDGAISADEKFSPRNKNKFINPQNGEIFNWGVKHDGQLGIWNATK